MPPLLEARNIWVVYGDGTIANKGVSISVDEGEIHGLLGENGAGKTTLVKALYGIVKPTSGEIFFRGSKVDIDSPKTARRLGIFMVPQHNILIPTLTGLENIRISYPYEDLEERVDEILNLLNVDIDLYTPVSSLPRGMVKKIEVVRALISGAKLIILDEPTSVMSPVETRDLIKMLESLSEEGYSFIYISHRLDEVVDICDRVTVLRDGSVVYNGEIRSISEIYNLMFRGELSSHIEYSYVEYSSLIRRDGLYVPDRGVYVILGVEGNGQDIYASKYVDELGGASVGYIPGHPTRAIVPGMSLVDNIYFRILDMDGVDPISLAHRVVERYEVLTDSIFRPIESLSGGNIQRFIIGRELEISDRYVVMEFPTRGLDVRSMMLVHKRVGEKIKDGKSVIYFTEDIEEALKLGDYISIIYRGKISRPLSRGSYDVDLFKRLMSGIGWNNEH